MVRDRIQIDGVWYVKEKDQSIDRMVVTDFQGCVSESKNYCFEASRIMRDDGTFYDDFDIKFTDKRNKPWKDETWDNASWFKALAKNEPYALKSAAEKMDPEGIKYFQAFIVELSNKDWL